MEPLDVTIRRAVKAALEETGGNQRKAAVGLGVSRWVVGRLVRKYGLEQATQRWAQAQAAPEASTP